MPLRHRNMLEVEMKEMKRRLLELEIKVAVQRVLLKTCNEVAKAKDEEESLYDEEVTPVDLADDDELYLYEGPPIYDEEVIDQANDEETYLYEGEPIYDKEVTSSDPKELLMIKQNLHTAVMEKEPSLCCNNFHTHYAFEKKNCNIDDGSCENIVYGYMVQKLKLPMLDYLHPHWLNTGSEMMKFESPQGVTSFSDVLADKKPPESPPDKPYYNADEDQRAKEIKKLHMLVHIRIQKQKPKARKDTQRKQRIFNVGDLVWIYLRFPKQPDATLSPYIDGPLKIEKKINDNTYKVDLTGAFATINVADLSSYFDDG